MRERRLTDITEFFPDFAAALAACGGGYNDPDIADVIAYKAALPVDLRQFAPEQALNSILPISIAAAEVGNRPLTVLDFGGGCGFHYFRTVAAVRTPLRWAIVETPTMAERALKLAKDRFEVFTDIAAAASALGRVDVVHASSVIQYVPDPLATLRTLAALRARYFALARFPRWTGPKVVAAQSSTLAGNGLGPMPPTIANRPVMYPLTFLNYDETLRTLSHYRVALTIESPSAVYVIRGQQTQGVTVFFRLKDDAPAA